MLYRGLLVVYLWAAVTAAPQDANIEFTNIPLKPLTNTSSAEVHNDTNFENIAQQESIDLTDSSIEKGEFVQQPDKNILSDSYQEYNRTDQNVGSEEQSDIGTTDIEPSGSELEESVASDDQSDSSPEATDQSGTRARYEFTTVSDFVDTTETPEVFEETVEQAPVRPKFASPRSISKFAVKKSNSYGFRSNLIRTEKRKFRSTCKCMKIWNCPKLQVSVGRCSEEYFLCCF